MFLDDRDTNNNLSQRSGNGSASNGMPIPIRNLKYVVIYFIYFSEETVGDDVFRQVWSVSESKRPDYVHLNTGNFKLPMCYGTIIDDMLNGKKGPNPDFTNNHFSAICRKLSDLVEETTIHPHPESLRFIVEKLLAKFPILIVDKKNQTSTIVRENSNFLKYISKV